MKSKTFCLFLLIIIFYEITNAQPLKLGQVVSTFYMGSNPDGYVLSVVDVRIFQTATQGVNWNAPKLKPTTADSLDWKGGRMGDVFGVTIDDEANIYVTATNVYGGFGFGTAGGGGIYKINAQDWSVTDFVTTDTYPWSHSITKIPNTNVGLGNICYDKWHGQLFVTNFENGKIYRLSKSGIILDTFDPFEKDDSTSGMVALGERVWGVGIYGTTEDNTRLYFSTWSCEHMDTNATVFNEIWSVGINSAGNFTGTEAPEIKLPHWEANNWSSPVASIQFSEVGNMLLAERSIRLSVQTYAHASRIMEYKKVNQTWQPKIIYIGELMPYANCAGGADYDYKQFNSSTGEVSECDSMIWATGDALRFADNNFVYGLAGIPAFGNSNVPEDDNYVLSSSYCIDLDGDIILQDKSTQGCVKVFRNCAKPPSVVISDAGNCLLPNVITPNNDGLNDTFRIPCLNGYLWKLQIYNRWGNLLYENNNYQNNWNADNTVDGTYYYLAVNSSIEKSYHGFIEVIH